MPFSPLFLVGRVPLLEKKAKIKVPTSCNLSTGLNLV